MLGMDVDAGFCNRLDHGLAVRDNEQRVRVLRKRLGFLRRLSHASSWTIMTTRIAGGLLLGHDPKS